MSISKHGQTTAVLMSFTEYQKLNGDHLTVADKLKIWREQFSHEFGKATEDFNVERTQDQGRDFSW